MGNMQNFVPKLKLVKDDLRVNKGNNVFCKVRALWVGQVLKIEMVSSTVLCGTYKRAIYDTATFLDLQ